ncbi:MAG: glycine cleavage system H protein [Porticoccaceae bacterium]|jgi:glycine cleavage system H protein|tara:strand:- start:858 stop:1235 length:378 start_codon:yes stop_codon:yes gene_type:complete
MDQVVYTKDHEWLKIEGNLVTIGVTQFAQEQLGDVVFIELPEVGGELIAGDEAAVIESVKAAGEIAVPIDGVVVAVNEALVDQPDLLNSAPETEGWIFQLTPSEDVEISNFMDAEQYQQFIQDGE